jgi:hypothetical protein
LELEDEEEDKHQVVLELEDVECSVVLGFCYDHGFLEKWIGLAMRCVLFFAYLRLWQ